MIKLWLEIIKLWSKIGNTKKIEQKCAWNEEEKDWNETLSLYLFPRKPDQENDYNDFL